MAKYADKKRQGLCGYSYNKSTKEFNEGAWRNWPRGMSDNERCRVGAIETASSQVDTYRRQRFTGDKGTDASRLREMEGQ